MSSHASTEPGSPKSAFAEAAQFVVACSHEAMRRERPIIRRAGAPLSKSGHQHDSSMAVPLGVPGLYAWDADFEQLLSALGRRLNELAGESSHVMRFPPLISRETIDRVRYREAFPHLLGEVTVCAEAPGVRSLPRSAAVVLVPAACYHVYPLANPTPGPGGQVFQIESWCFRNESGNSPSRQSAFRMREFVKIGDADTVYSWRQDWIDRVLGFARAVGLDAHIAPASDPFFGPRAKQT